MSRANIVPTDFARRCINFMTQSFRIACLALLACAAVESPSRFAHAQLARLPIDEPSLGSQPMRSVDDVMPRTQDMVGVDDSFGLWSRGAGDGYGAGATEPWEWQLLPSSLIYRSYLAGVKESRFASNHINLDGNWFWEATLGTRVGLVRYGDNDPFRPNGWQLDVEGAAQARLNITDNVDVTSVDFRGGLPLTYGNGPHRFKTGYYHLSSHLGDEFLLNNPGFPRLNYARDVLIFGYSYYATPKLRLYGETGWAFYSDVGEPWEFQFGVDYAPTGPTGIYGAPFFAVNGHVRQELDFSGNLVVQAGWAWVGDQNARMFRIGGHYYNGASSQYSFYQNHEQQIGLGVWYDF